jgi:hypothetical protein
MGHVGAGEEDIGGTAGQMAAITAGRPATRPQEEAKVEAVVQEDTSWSRLPPRNPAKEDGQRGSDGRAAAAPAASEPRFSAPKLTLGNTSESDLKQAIGLDDPAVPAQCTVMPLTQMARQWRENSSDADWVNFNYIRHGKAHEGADVPLYVRETFRKGRYHGGSIREDEYAGHDGMDLAAFCELDA